MRHGRLLVALAGATLIAGCGSSSSPSGSGGSGNTLSIALNIPVTADPYVAQAIKRGADLAVREANAKGVTIGSATYQLALRVYDDSGQPQSAATNVDAAVHDGAVAILEDGVGASASAAHSNTAGVPEIVIANGTADLMDPKARPSLFRLGIANDAAATLLGKYIAGKSATVAIIHDDSDYGRDGADQLSQALATAGATAGPNIEVSATSTSFDAQLQRVAGSKAGALAIWGGDTFVAQVVSAAHSSGLSLPPLYAGPTGESPAVRAVAGSAATDGLHFVSSRMTAEDDTSSFGQFEHRLASAEGGPTDAGFKNGEGQEVRQPNDFDLFAYDAVNLVVAGLKKNGSATPGSGLITAVGSVSVPSANGDTRGFNPDNHEGVSDDDMYIAVIHDMTFAPVQDEELSKTLPTDDQILADFH